MTSQEKSRQATLDRYYSAPNRCAACGKLIAVPDNTKVREIRIKKFCDRSCANTFNNQKRKPATRPTSPAAASSCTEGQPLPGLRPSNPKSGRAPEILRNLHSVHPRPRRRLVRRCDQRLPVLQGAATGNPHAVRSATTPIGFSPGAASRWYAPNADILLTSRSPTGARSMIFRTRQQCARSTTLRISSHSARITTGSLIAVC